MAGAFQDSVDAFHQFLVETIDGVCIVQRQQAEKVAHFATRLGRTLGDVEVEQFLEQSLLEHQTPEQRLGRHGSQKSQTVIQSSTGATVATSRSRRQRDKLIAIDPSRTLSRTRTPHGFLSLTGIVSHNITATGGNSLGNFAQFFKCRLAFRMVTLTNLLDRFVNLPCSRSRSRATSSCWSRWASRASR